MSLVFLAESGLSSGRGCGPEGPAAEDSLRKLLLSFNETGPSSTISSVNQFEEDDGQNGAHCEQNGHHHHHSCHCFVRAKHREGRDPAAVAPAGDAHSLDDEDDNLTEEDEEEEEEAEGAVGSEGLVDRSEPAEEGTGREQQEPEQSQTKVHSVQRVCGEQGQSRENVQEQGDHAHHPEVVEHLNNSLMLSRNLFRKILIKTGFYRETLRQWRPVILFTSWCGAWPVVELFFSFLQFSCFFLQFFLSFQEFGLSCCCHLLWSWFCGGLKNSRFIRSSGAQNLIWKRVEVID